MLRSIVQAFSDLVSTAWNENDDDRVEMVEMPLDPRWEPIGANSDEWYFRNHHVDEHDFAPSVVDASDNHSRFTAPSISVNDLVSHIQRVHKTAFEIDTTTELARTAAVSGSSSRRAPGASGGAVLLQNRSKSRRIRKVRHEIEMNRRRHEFNKKRLDYLLFTLDNRHMIQPDTFTIGDNEEVNSRKPVPSFHLIRDFDEIQQLYDECVLDAVNIEHNLKILNRRSQADIDAENDTLTRFVRSYLWGPIEKDEYYREINNSIFQEFDEDPIHMAATTNRERKWYDVGKRTIRTNNVYPQLGILSKRSQSDRQKRRRLLLSVGEEEEEYDIEVERVSALLSQIIHK